MPTSKKDLDALHQHILAIIGHDLRNPLSVIKLTGDALLRAFDDHIPQQQREGILRILRVAGRMDRMVASLLELAQFREGTLTLTRATCSLKSIVKRQIDDLMVINPGCKFELTREGPVSGNWDSVRLERVVANLLSNACEHRDEGTPVKIHIHGDGQKVVVEVVNKGEPIPVDLLQKIWSPMERGRSKGGSLGLGLFITKFLVELHGGTVEVESLPDDWIVFRFSLPVT